MDTGPFWDAMCDVRFHRLSPHYGQIEGRVIYCGKPPELVPGFIEDKINRILHALEEPPSLWQILMSWWRMKRLIRRL